MGMLIDGRWTEHNQTLVSGSYQRPESRYRQPLDQHILSAMEEEPDRFLLISSWSCPWSHRLLLVRALKRLESVITIHTTGGARLEGYPVHSGKPWTLPGTDKVIHHLHQLYTANDPGYSGRVTVPLLWDCLEARIVSNESTQIMQALDRLPAGPGLTDFTLRPESRTAEIDALNDKIYRHLSNAVYRAGFATEQSAYQDAVADVFETLDWLEIRLARHRYLLGSALTEADWRLFPTLVRFDIDYVLHSRCTKHRLVDYPNLWAYARDLYQWPGIAETVNFDAIHHSNHQQDTVTPLLPSNDWWQPHQRESLGAAQVWNRRSELMKFQVNSDTSSFQVS